MNDNYYCSAAKADCVVAAMNTDMSLCPNCPCHRRKWETPEQFKERTGREWAGALYCRNTEQGNQKWYTFDMQFLERQIESRRWKPGEILCVCANTDFGPPPDGWVPEEGE